MRLPLYRYEDYPRERSQDANVGLWFDKFCNQWDEDDWELDSKGKYNWMKTVADDNKLLGDAELIKEMQLRQAKLTHQLNGQLLFFKTDGRFITGMGREHPVENGVCWHHTLGIPYLPGSSIKGIVRSWAKTWLKDDKVEQICGPEDDNARQVGSVIFFDALPVKPIKMEIDIMTPHYSEYYRENVPPADCYSPIPIPFLTVAGEQSFMFSLAPRRPGDESNLEDVKIAAEWLEQALTIIGAGAKTAAGYGRFMPDAEAKKAWQKYLAEEKQALEKERQEQLKQEKLAAMTPLRREMEEDGYSDDIQAFKNAIATKWLDRMESADREEGIEIAELLMNWYQEKDPKQWNKPNKKNKEKINRIKAVLNKK